MGRPRIKIDMDRVMELASKGATQEEIASDLGVSVDTLQRRKDFAVVYKTGMDKGRLSLRHKQFNIALGGKGNVTMLIWLGKQLLGQSDKSEVKADMTHEITEKPPEELTLDEILDIGMRRAGLRIGDN